MNRLPSISYYNERGEITGTLSATADAMALTKKHTPLAWVEGKHDKETHYVNTKMSNQVMPRPRHPIVLSRNTLHGLIPPCIIEINGTEYECTSTQATLNFDQPTTYTIRVIKWPYLDREFTIDYQP